MGRYGNKMNFFENNSKLKPHKILVNFIKNNPSIKTAIDLGCGAGRDTKFLVQNNIIVTAIDRVDVTKFLYKDLTEEEKARLNFVQAKFSEIDLPKTEFYHFRTMNHSSQRNYIRSIHFHLKNRLFYLAT